MKGIIDIKKFSALDETDRELKKASLSASPKKARAVFCQCLSPEKQAIKTFSSKLMGAGAWRVELADNQPCSFCIRKRAESTADRCFSSGRTPR